MTKSPLSLKRRLLRLSLWLAGIALALLTYGELLGSQTDAYFMAHHTAHNAPEVNISPQSLTDNATSQAPGTTLSYYGITFEVPWTGISEQKTARNVAALKSASGQALIIWAPTGKEGMLYDIATDEKGMGGPTMNALLAQDIKESPYAQESALLTSSASQVRFLDPPRVSWRRAFLLLFKAMAEDPELKSGIYAFQSSPVRGFQLGNPAYASRIRLDFFDSAGNSLGEVVCFFGKDASARGTQADLNRIIQTFHPVANSAAAVPTTGPRLTSTKPPGK